MRPGSERTVPSADLQGKKYGGMGKSLNHPQREGCLCTNKPKEHPMDQKWVEEEEEEGTGAATAARVGQVAG